MRAHEIEELKSILQNDFEEVAIKGRENFQPYAHFKQGDISFFIEIESDSTPSQIASAARHELVTRLMKNEPKFRI